MNFTRISVEEAVELIRDNPETAQIVDIRDDQSFETKHIDSAVHLHNSNLPEFLDQADLEAPLLVYCYHGHMSQSAAAFLAEHGFKQVFSIDGGFEAWKLLDGQA